MDLDWLKDFVALAEHGNFSRAAELRHVTQPAFSRRIRALEDWVGAALFVRGPQGATLSPAGVQFLAVASDVLRDLERARRAAQAAEKRSVQALSIAATNALSFTFFPAWSRRHIDIAAAGSLNLVSDHMAACEEMLESGEVQLLLCHWHPGVASRLDPARFEAQVIGIDTLIAYSAPEADGRPRWPLRVQEGRPRVLAYSDQSGLGRIVQAHATRFPEARAWDVRFTSHLAITLANMTKEGAGLAWLPLSLVADDVAAGRLVRAGDDAYDIAVSIVLVRALTTHSDAVDRLWRSVQSQGASMAVG